MSFNIKTFYVTVLVSDWRSVGVLSFECAASNAQEAKFLAEQFYDNSENGEKPCFVVVAKAEEKC